MKNNISACRVLLTGATLSGNLGGQALYDSIADELQRKDSTVEFSILSKYSEDDAAGCQERGYTLIPFSTLDQLIFGGSFFIVGSILKFFHLPTRWLAGKRLRAFYENDILVDASGIAFTDDRSFTNVLINALWFLPALVSGIPIIKVSQTLGPYQKWYVRFFGNLVLKRIHILVCRGQQSYEYTKAFLKKGSIYNLPDVAFCLQPADKSVADTLLRTYGLTPERYIAVGPSFVMQNFLQPGRYVEIVSSCINQLADKTDLSFVLVPHSWKHRKKLGVDSVHDDLSVCQEIAQKVDPHVSCIVIGKELSAREFKSIIGNAHMAIGSRYHFLIAALSSGVPSMALGWSHKYRELFREFDMVHFVLEYKNMSRQNVCALAEELLARRDECYTLIRSKLDDVKKRSAKNEELILSLLNNHE